VDRSAALHRPLQEDFVQQQTIRVTDFDSRHLEGLIEGSRPRDLRDARSIELLEQHLGDAEVLPARHISPDVVTMNSEVRVRDLDAHETITFRVVFPHASNAAAAGRISVLAPLGMAVLGQGGRTRHVAHARRPAAASRRARAVPAREGGQGRPLTFRGTVPRKGDHDESEAAHERARDDGWAGRQPAHRRRASAMLSGWAAGPAPANTRVEGRERSLKATGRMTPLQVMLRDEVAREDGALQVEVIDDCGVVEVRVSGPAGQLRLNFDRAQLTPAFARNLLRRRLKDYGASLGCRAGPKGQSRKEARR
jgi:regulator of nucleoside diphosphate kinase